LNKFFIIFFEKFGLIVYFCFKKKQRYNISATFYGIIYPMRWG